MTVKIISIVTFICLSFSLVSQTVTVKDKETDLTIPSVTLKDRESNTYEISDINGRVDVSSFKKSEAIEIRAVGYKPTVATFEDITASETYYLAPSITSLNDMVVYGTRVKQLLSEMPNRVISISPKEVALQNPQTAADLLGSSGKVFIQKSQQGGGSPMIRGFATNRLLYTIDGVRMNTAIFRGGNLQNVISLDPFAIEGTEVIFGPGSVLYGSDAIGGVMSFQTLTPQFTLEDNPTFFGHASTRFASANNEKTGHFDFNIGWKKWAMVTSVSYNDYGDLMMGSHGPDDYLRPFYVERIDTADVVIANENDKIQNPTGYKQINLMQKIRFQPNNHWDFQYGFHYSETSDYSRYDRHIRLRNGAPRYGEWKYGPQKWMMNNLTITNNYSNIMYDQMVVRLAHQFFEESRISRDFNSPERETRIEEVQAYSANADFVKRLHKNNKLFYGVEWVYNDVTSQGINENIIAQTQSVGPARYPQAFWQSAGIYISDQQNVNDKLLLKSSLRYSFFQIDAQFDTTFYPFTFTNASIVNSAVTGSLGATYQPAKDWMISTNLATAFRSPNVDDVGKVFDSEPGAVTVPNPSLTAEYAYNADINIAKTIKEWCKIEISGYYTLLENALVRRDYELAGQDSIMYDGVLSKVQAIQNAAQANVYGVQGSLTFKFNKQFSFSNDINYQIGSEELDDGSVSPSRHAAPVFGVSRLSFQMKGLRVDLYANYSGEKSFDELPESEKGKDYLYAKDDEGNPYSPSWATLNLKALFKVNDYLSLSGGVENITDQRYRPYSSGLTAPSRNFILSARCSF